MPQIHTPGGKPASGLLVLALASIALAACGGSSNSSSSSSTSAATNAAASSSASATSATGRSGAFAARASALRECLSKHGITLPQRKPGQYPGATGRPLTAGPQLPAGVTRSQYEAALKACGGFPRFAGTGGAFRSPLAHAALTKFASCMSENGVKLPKANTSGGGPIFNVKGVDTRSSTFKAAEAKCRADLLSVFGARRGAGAGAPPPTSG